LYQLNYHGIGGLSAFQTRRESEEEESESSSSYQGRLSRDERLVKDMRIPLTVKEIIEKPMEEFNDLLTRKDINEEQINICRDIRRRGKNKVRNILKLLSKPRSTKIFDQLNLKLHSYVPYSRLQPRTVEKEKLTKSAAWRQT
jgi:hypothetical protein